MYQESALLNQVNSYQRQGLNKLSIYDKSMYQDAINLKRIQKHHATNVNRISDINKETIKQMRSPEAKKHNQASPRPQSQQEVIL